MELNKRYLESEFPIKNLSAGTIIEVYFNNKFPEYEGDLLLITIKQSNDSDVVYNEDHDIMVAISVKDAKLYTENHSIYDYEIKRL